MSSSSPSFPHTPQTKKYIGFAHLEPSPPQSESDDEELINECHIQDPVHGYMEIPDDIKTIIDTPHFQRLRNLKQLGTSYWVFPGASHNRFEHSIGVMFLARKLLTRLDRKQPKLNITADEFFCVSAAALLHDIGHGPYSHVFDNEFMPMSAAAAVASVTDKKFRHEDMSVMLIDDLFARIHDQIPISDDNRTLIKALISPSTHGSVYEAFKQKKRAFLFEIVANELSGVDVDKWDYMLRDSKMIGISISFSYERLIEHVRVINDHICWQEKTSFQLYEMFRTRYELFKKVYSHKAAKSIEYMICDILKYANDVFNIVGKATSCESYLQLDDTILQQIKYYQIDDDDQSEAMLNMRKAQHLILRLETRALYKCCGYLLLSADDMVRFNPQHTQTANNTNKNKNSSESGSVREPKIAYRAIQKQWKQQLFAMYLDKYGGSYIDGDKQRLMEGDIVVQIMSLSFGLETSHPMEQVYLYNAKTPKRCKQVSCHQITHMSDPKQFREVVVRAYCKREEWKPECEQLFKTFACNQGLTAPQQSNDVGPVSSHLSPQTQRKYHSRREEDQGVQQPLNVINDINGPTASPTRKRPYDDMSSPLQSTSASESLDFMDEKNRNKRRKTKET